MHYIFMHIWRNKQMRDFLKINLSTFPRKRWNLPLQSGSYFCNRQFHNKFVVPAKKDGKMTKNSAWAKPVQAQALALLFSMRSARSVR